MDRLQLGTAGGHVVWAGRSRASWGDDPHAVAADASLGADRRGHGDTAG